MKILDRPFADYVREARIGIILLLAVAVVRFLMKPVFGVSYEQGTHFTSSTALLPVLMLFYSMRVIRTRGTYRDMLGFSAVLSLSQALFVALGIGADDFGGIDTYYTDLAHGGSINPSTHMLAHLIGGIFFTLILWGMGSLLYAISRRGKKP
jgi:hypothetical protein